jgi:hypothetical protein
MMLNELKRESLMLASVEQSGSMALTIVNPSRGH